MAARGAARAGGRAEGPADGGAAHCRRRPRTAAQAARTSFLNVTNGIAQVNNQLIGSQVDLQKLATGDAQNLHQIMINLEESRLSFQLMMQVRSRLLEAYQDIMKMPI